MPYKIKMAGLEDIAQIGELFNQYRMFYDQKADQEGAICFISERMKREESVILVAVHHSRVNTERNEAGAEEASGDSVEPIAGFAQLYPSFSSVSMGKIWILNDLFVHPDHRRQGIAGMLLEAAREMACRDRSLRIVLSTALDNVQAQRIYESKGYIQDSHFMYYELELLPENEH